MASLLLVECAGHWPRLVLLIIRHQEEIKKNRSVLTDHSMHKSTLSAVRRRPHRACDESLDTFGRGVVLQGRRDATFDVRLPWSNALGKPESMEQTRSKIASFPTSGRFAIF
jgi:hypothetical protein